MVAVAELIYYPIKGCAGTSVSRTEVGPAGLTHDRAFVITGADGEFRSQRGHPLLAVVRPSADGGGLRVSAPGMADLEVETVDTGAPSPVTVFAWQGTGIDQGEVAARWFTDLLGEPCRLMGLARDHDRVTTGETAGTTGFADGHAMLIASEASLDLLNERIAGRGGAVVGMDRFRPNVILSGWSEPHTEDRVRTMTMGQVTVGFAKVCIRCTVPMVDQETGAKDGPEPIRTLADYRRSEDGGVTFGMKAAVIEPGQLAVGDAATVHSWATA